jgi:hypothetical protein
MKYVVILLVLFAIFVWLSWRFRRQIAFARQMWKMFVETNRRLNQQQQQVGNKQPPQKIPAGKLVRCEKCQTWVPRDSALSFGKGTYFCSAQCMEKSVVNGGQ